MGCYEGIWLKLESYNIILTNLATCVCPPHANDETGAGGQDQPHLGGSYHGGSYQEGGSGVHQKMSQGCCSQW